MDWTKSEWKSNQNPKKTVWKTFRKPRELLLKTNLKMSSESESVRQTTALSEHNSTWNGEG